MSFKHYLSLQDYFLTQEKFDLHRDETTGLIKTIPQPDDLGKYYESEDYLSHDDTATGLFATLYKISKKWNLASKVDLVKNWVAQGKVLDIGAGVGDLVKELEKSNFTATGFEPSSKARSVASGKGVNLSPSLDNFEPNSFDLITMYHVLEHVPDLNLQKQQIIKLLKPQGIFIVALPNYESFDARYYGKLWAAYDVPRHLFHFNKTAVSTLFEDSFEIVAMKPLWLDSFYVSILSERYKKSSLPFVRGLIIGFVSNMMALFTKEPSSITYVLKKRI